jgi:hypothetical protein
MAAATRAVALDPNNVSTVAAVAQERTERNQTGLAYHDLLQLSRRRPDSARLHFALGYVLRYAGVLDQAERECNTALMLDVQDGGLKSCAVPFILRGDYQRARDYLNLDRGTEWGRVLLVDLLLREGREKEALQERPATEPQWAGYGMLFAFLEHRPNSDVAALARTLQPVHDPEVNYWAAAHLAYARQTEAALRMLKVAIDQGYCATQDLDSDTMLANIRALPQFAAIRAAAATCRATFLAEAGKGAS